MLPFYFGLFVIVLSTVGVLFSIVKTKQLIRIFSFNGVKNIKLWLREKINLHENKRNTYCCFSFALKINVLYIHTYICYDNLCKLHHLPHAMENFCLYSQTCYSIKICIHTKRKLCLWKHFNLLCKQLIMFHYSEKTSRMMNKE